MLKDVGSDVLGFSILIMVFNDSEKILLISPILLVGNMLNTALRCQICEETLTFSGISYISPMIHHEPFMQRCFSLASKGLGMVAPNPIVGAVIVHEGKIIADGHHYVYGGPHAEVVAIRNVLFEEMELLPNSTLYVNLEPCSHFGKTPPCTNLILEHNIPRVVISCIDTNEKVAGKGIEKLQQAGVEVTVGVLEKEGRLLNRRFFTYHEKKTSVYHFKMGTDSRWLYR